MWFRKGGGGLKLDTWRYRSHLIQLSLLLMQMVNTLPINRIEHGVSGTQIIFLRKHKLIINQLQI
jgi:hypothetical protein